MTTPIDLDSPQRAPLSGGAAKQLVILLHGLGADGEDLLPLADHFAPFLPDAAFLSPHAPQKCDMAPVGFQWFSLQSAAPDDILHGVTQSAPLLQDYIDRALQTYSLEEENLVLIGFSQGTMMALYCGLRRAKPIAGIIGYSGAHVHGEDWQKEITAKPPVLLIHGEADPVVHVLASEAARAELAEIGVPVELHKRPGLPHGIDEQGIEQAQNFLRRIFKLYDA